MKQSESQKRGEIWELLFKIGDRVADCRLMGMIQEKGTKEKKRGGISAEAMPLGRGEWMELENKDRGQFHLHMRQQKTGDQHNGQQMWVRGLS